MKPEKKSIQVKLFGSLREFGDSTRQELTIQTGHSVQDLKTALAAYFDEAHPGSNAIEILKDSAFADERTVLSADATLEGRSWIAVLPPVCGG